MTITEEKAATADQRYTETLEAIQALGTKGSELAMELDEIVGERLGDCRTDGIAEGMGGVVIDGNIMLPGSSQRGSYVTVVIPAKGECGCTFNCESWHDPLLAMERNAGIVGAIWSDLVEGHGRWGDDGAEWGEIATFIDEHHWNNQPDMHQLAELIRRFETLAS